MLGVMYLMCWGSCICVLGSCTNVLEVYVWVGGHVFMCWGSCICVLGVMYLCVGVMYLCVGGHIYVYKVM